MTAPELTSVQVRAIGRQEGACDQDLAEALRRLQQNPHFLADEVHNLPAFFRGILRGVLADHMPAPAAPPPLPRPALPPASASTNDQTFGRICLRALHLFRTGATDADVIATLVCEFHDTSIVDLTQAIDRGRQLHRALCR